MRWQSRAMRAHDVAECAEIVAMHPSIGPRYRGAVDDLRVAWMRLTAGTAARAIVFEEVGGARIAGISVTVFVRDDFLRELKTPPLQWFGPELARRIAGGRSPLLSDKQIRDANSDGGLNLLTWEICTRPEDARTPELLTNMVSALIGASGVLLEGTDQRPGGERRALEDHAEDRSAPMEPCGGSIRGNANRGSGQLCRSSTHPGCPA